MRVQVKRTKKMELPTTISGPKTVKVGFPAGVSDQSEVMKAIYNEFGTQGGGWGGPIPERPFMRTAIKENKNKYSKYLKAAAKSILTAKDSLFSVLSGLGVISQGDIRKSITSFDTPPNSPVTIAIKGSNDPLVNVGLMRKAVTYEVEK